MIKKRLPEWILVIAILGATVIIINNLWFIQRDIIPAKKTDKAVEISIAWWGSQIRNERTQAVLDMYEKNNPEISFQKTIGEKQDYWNLLSLAAAGHQLPDLMQTDGYSLDKFVENDLLLDLTPYIEDGSLETGDIDPTVLNWGSVKGRIYGICAGINAPALLYNKMMLDSYNIVVEDRMDLKAFGDLCEQIYEKTRYKTNLAYRDSYAFLNYVLRGRGLSLFQGEQLGVYSSQDFQPFFELYERGAKEGWLIEPSIFAQRTIGVVEQDPLIMGTGPSNMSWCGFYYSNQLIAAKESMGRGYQIGIASWPADSLELANYVQAEQFYSISAYSENKEDAIKVINYFINDDSCNQILLDERGIPISAEMAELVKQDASEVSWQIYNYIEKVILPESSVIVFKKPSNAKAVYDLIDQLQDRIYNGEITAKEASEALFIQGDALLQRRYSVQ
ncbi:ABC transporter substrate-binding protein [Cellulosilyticum sp. I15G10I2]|uniref:ABC transporter substrate-binding protein n=1 Tax=Cellulosilyticum sp. I15G10I2 TaxID=1892843 RepID=UPI00085C1747|nr:extracellular solute-binding protein [Cellulosilyticum sp. I15G10I2]